MAYSTNDPSPPVAFLMGPTGSGKTDLAVELVERLPLEIINVDSALVYDGLDIGAARPAPEVLEKAPHRLMGFRDPAKPYSAAEFRRDALREIADIQAGGRVPLLVGGTMLYFSTLVRGLAPLPEADPKVRARLDAEARELGWPALHRRLAEVDPETAARLGPRDRQRLQRALEVHELTGIPLSRHHRVHRKDAKLLDNSGESPPDFPFTLVSMALAPASRAVLHERIALRFRKMLEQGLVEEVEGLLRRGDLDPELPALRAVGYRQVRQHLEGQYDRREMEERAIAATRQLAKRQLTWLRKWPQLHWIDSDAPDRLEQAQGLLESAVEWVFS